MKYKVTLCGLTARDARLIEIVIARAPNAKYVYELGASSGSGGFHIVVVDEASLTAVQHELENLRRANPDLVTVHICDSLSQRGYSYSIERKSLLLHIGRVLDSAVEAELLSGATRNGAALSARPNPGQSVQSPQDRNQTFLRALVVDDSAAVRAQLVSALERAGIRSDQAESAESAQTLLVRNRYDLVFLDVVMPGVDGYEVCRQIKKNTYTRGTPVIMLTSRSSPFDRARGALAGCDSYLVKPVSWESFFATVDKVLAKQFRNDRASLAERGYLLSATHP